MAQTDYILDDDLDLIIENGDLKRGNCDQQAAILVINTNIGAWKRHPFCGLGITRYKGSTGQNLRLTREMSVQLQTDGFKNIDLQVVDFTNFYLSAERDGDN